MSSVDEHWDELREQAEQLIPGTELTTPVSGRRFEIESTFSDRIVVRFQDSGEERPLHRDQFEVLLQRLDDGPIPVAGLPPGVEPYATTVTLLDEYTADDESIRGMPEDADPETSPYLVSPEEARTPPERVHDDALLLADLLEHFDADNPQTLDTDSLTDLYVMLSDVQRGSDRLRKSTREPLLARLGPDQSLSGRFGMVRRTTRERRRAKDDEVILDALDEHGIPHEWVLGVDPDKLDVVLAATDLTEDEVYDVDEQVYVQKTDVEEAEKYSHLQGLADRIAEVEGDEGEVLRDDLDDLEARLDRALSAD